MITKESLLKSEEKVVDLDGLGEIRIRKLKVGEMIADEGTPEAERTAKMIASSIIEPALTAQEVLEIPGDIAVAIQREIMAFNGLGDISTGVPEKN